jgi:peptide deformylase
MCITISTFKRITDKRNARDSCITKNDKHTKENKAAKTSIPRRKRLTTTTTTLTNSKSYSSMATQQIGQKKQLMIVQPAQQKLRPIIRQQQQTSSATQAMIQPTQTNSTAQEARTFATNNSGLSVDQQTITTMMT